MNLDVNIFFTGLSYQVENVRSALVSSLSKIQAKNLENNRIFDAVSSATGTIDQLTNGIQLICYAAAALFLAVGAFQYLTGGDESMRKAKHRWIGVGVGLIVAVGTMVIRDYIKSKAQFN